MHMSSKNTFYFSHDANAHEDDKIICLMSEYGSQGYGWWWIMVEVLFQQQGCKLDLSNKTTIPYLYRMLWDMPIKDIPIFIDKLVEFGLLSRDGDLIYSESLIKRNDKIDALREKRRAAANARWKKEKVKEEEPAPVKPKKPVDKTKTIEVLRNEEMFAEFVKELQAHEIYSALPINQTYSERESCLNWLASKGTTKKDYKAFFKNWIKKKIDDKGFNNNSNQPKMVY